MLSILIMVVNGIMTLAAFSWVLWSITPWLFLIAYGYAGIGLLGTILLGRRLTKLNNQQIQREADFRYGLGRLREHAEAIAQAASEEEQKVSLIAGLERLVESFLNVIRVNRNLGFFLTAFDYMPQIIPVVVVAPLYIRGAVPFGAVTQAAMAFAQVQGAFRSSKARPTTHDVRRRDPPAGCSMGSDRTESGEPGRSRTAAGRSPMIICALGALCS